MDNLSMNSSIADIPYLKAAHQKYKDKRLMSDLKGGDELRKVYHFNGIPYAILVDREGKILISNLRERSFITRQGVSMLDISDAAESIGMRTQGVRISLQQLIEDVLLPCILHWNQNHFVVLYDIRKKKNLFG